MAEGLQKNNPPLQVDSLMQYLSQIQPPPRSEMSQAQATQAPPANVQPIMQAIGQSPVQQSTSEMLAKRINEMQLQGLQEQRASLADTRTQVEAMRKNQKPDLSALAGMADILTGSGGEFSKIYSMTKPKGQAQTLQKMEALLAKQGKDLSASELGVLKEQFKQMEGQTGIGELTKGQEAADKVFGKDYAEYFAGGGYTDIRKGIEQLEGVEKMLKDPNSPNLTGGLLSLQPDMTRRRFAPESMQTQQAVEEIVQRNLKAILGSQFTQKEGERLIERAYDVSQDEAENAKRVGALVKQMKTAALEKERAAKHWERFGTLKGFKGKSITKNDFLAEAEKYLGPDTQDFDAMSDEELEKAYKKSLGGF